MKHKHSHLLPVERRPAARLVLALAAVLLLGAGSLTLALGKLHYPNHWGGQVFAPFAVAIGLIALVGAIRGKPFH